MCHFFCRIAKNKASYVLHSGVLCLPFLSGPCAFGRQLDQPGLGMPDREYYMKAKSESEFVQAYLNFMRGVVQLMGAPAESVEDQLVHLLDFETRLANVNTASLSVSVSLCLYLCLSVCLSAPPLSLSLLQPFFCLLFLVVAACLFLCLLACLLLVMVDGGEGTGWGSLINFALFFNLFLFLIIFMSLYFSLELTCR